MKTLTITAALAASLLASPALADDRLELELSIPIGVADRSTAAPELVPGYGYENQTGLLLGADARLYAGGNRYFQLGVALSGAHHAGPALGLADGYAFRSTMLDAGLAGRVRFPCMSGGDTRVHLSGVLGLSGLYADAGEGVGGRPNGPDAEARRAAAAQLDHGALGWRFALDLAWHLGNFIVGGGIGVRQHFGLDTAVARDLVLDVGLRIGGRIDLLSDDAHGV
ncbi:MAG: hypothetical protein RLO52_31870 [Sandaracinaceae bacterium]